MFTFFHPPQNHWYAEFVFQRKQVSQVLIKITASHFQVVISELSCWCEIDTYGVEDREEVDIIRAIRCGQNTVHLIQLIPYELQQMPDRVNSHLHDPDRVNSHPHDLSE